MSEFSEKVDTYLVGLQFVSVGPCPGCSDCGLEDIEDMNTPEYQSSGEPFFSWHSCETCGSSLGGDRHQAHAILPAPEPGQEETLVHMDICTDCLFYLAYGDEPAPED